MSIVIPAFNEEAGIAATLDALTRDAPEAEVIVIDDGSDDRTAQIALGFAKIIVAQHPFNRGYGAALKTGISIATREYVAWFDADNEHRVSDLAAMALIVSSRGLAAVVAQRRFSGPSPVRTLGKFFIRLAARSLKFSAGKDINCGLRVFRRDVISRYVDLLPNGFSASITSTVIMLERGYPIDFYPIELNPRIGVSKVKVADGFHAFMLLMRIFMLFAPMRIFLRAGVMLFFAGILYGLGWAILTGRGVPAGAVLLTLGGILSGFFGLIADQISQMRLSRYDRPIYRITSSPPADGL
ncbi:MAG TPA: glycosyltransferase family 2 protein [Burkholderiaceae bacterium]|nr:glycosyltransferase family 2 protein [Burkholderiaceae bacterium]